MNSEMWMRSKLRINQNDSILVAKSFKFSQVWNGHHHTIHSINEKQIFVWFNIRPVCYRSTFVECKYFSFDRILLCKLRFHSQYEIYNKYFINVWLSYSLKFSVPTFEYFRHFSFEKQFIFLDSSNKYRNEAKSIKNK